MLLTVLIPISATLKNDYIFFEDKKKKSEKPCKKYKTITTLIKSFDTFFINTTTSSLITLSLTGIGLKAVPISTASAWGLSIRKKVIYEIIINKYSKYKKTKWKRSTNNKMLQ